MIISLIIFILIAPLWLLMGVVAFFEEIVNCYKIIYFK